MQASTEKELQANLAPSQTSIRRCWQLCAKQCTLHRQHRQQQITGSRYRTRLHCKTSNGTAGSVNSIADMDDAQLLLGATEAHNVSQLSNRSNNMLLFDYDVQDSYSKVCTCMQLMFKHIICRSQPD